MGSSTQRRLAYRPIVECFEDRLVLSCTVSVLDLNGDGEPDLQVVGDAGKQELTITDDPSRNQTIVQLDCNGDGDLEDAGDLDQVFATTFEHFDIQLKGGNDVLTFEAAEGTDYSEDFRDLSFDLGKGNDTVVTMLQGTVGTTDLFFKIWLKGGNDQFTGKFNMEDFEVTEGARTWFTVDGGSGRDTLTMTHDGEDGTVDIGGSVEFILRGSTGKDNTTVNLAGPDALRLTGELVLHCDSGLGDDNAMVSVRNTGDSNGNYKLQVKGNGGSDQIIFGLFDASQPIGFATVDGGTGKDACTLSPTQNGMVLMSSIEA